MFSLQPLRIGLCPLTHELHCNHRTHYIVYSVEQQLEMLLEWQGSSCFIWYMCVLCRWKLVTCLAHWVKVLAIYKLYLLCCHYIYTHAYTYIRASYIFSDGCAASSEVQVEGRNLASPEVHPWWCDVISSAWLTQTLLFPCQNDSNFLSKFQTFFLHVVILACTIQGALRRHEKYCCASAVLKLQQEWVLSTNTSSREAIGEYVGCMDIGEHVCICNGYNSWRARAIWLNAKRKHSCCGYVATTK